MSSYLKKIITWIIVLIICLLIYVILKKPELTKPNHTNTSGTQVITNVISKETILKKIKNNRQAHETTFNWLEGYEKNSDHTPQVGLIQAFREFKKVKRCRHVIESQTENTDAYEDFLKRRNKIQLPKNWKELTLIQKQYFDFWAESCRNFMDADNELYITVHERHRKRFYQTKAITKIEKDFAQSWPLIEETRFINFKYDNLINGYDINNSQLVNDMSKQLQRLRGMLKYIHINEDIEFSSRTSNEINMYKQQLAELESIVDGSTIVNEEYLVNLYQEYDANFIKVDTFLKQNISSDAFLTLAPIIFKSKHLELGFYDTRYYKTLLSKVTKLFACSMDAQCDTESKTMVSECFKHSNNANELACGLSVEDYYLSYYYSPNQLLDVSQIINYFFDNYAKN